MSAPDRRSRFPASRPRAGGHADGAALAIVERPMTLIQVTARRGRQAEVAAAMARDFGLALPAAGAIATGADKAALWLQPESWLITAPAALAGSLPAALATAVKGIAAVVDQSHGRCVLDISGEAARAVLARLCRLDLDARAFAPDRCAATLVGHVPCLVHRTGTATPGFSLIVASTFAEWLLDQIAAAAASCGWRFTPANAVAA